MKRVIYLLPLISLISCHNIIKKTADSSSPASEYQVLSDSLTSGWNTWDNRSIMTHVFLPHGFAVILELQEGQTDEILEYAFTGNRVEGSEKVETYAHTPDGSYTHFDLHWRKLSIKVQSVSDDENLYIRIIKKNPENNNEDNLIVKNKFIYGENGKISTKDRSIIASSDDREFITSLAGNTPRVSSENSLTIPLKDTIYVLNGNPVEAKEIDLLISDASKKWNKMLLRYEDYSEVYNAIQNAVFWTVVYDPVNDRAVTPVARTWAYGWGQGKPGGWVQFCWDNFFVAYMQAMESKELAFNEAIQMCNYIDKLGFVPNYAGPGGVASHDRSQPPVGSMMIREIYKMHPEKWFLEKTFDQLLTWNRWWTENRDQDGYLTWGSTPFKSETGDTREQVQNNFKAASYESGLDNTPMYDGVPFDTAEHMLKIADVGLTSLFIGDCDALADIAGVLEREEEKELRKRAGYSRENLKMLWDDEFGLFLNKRTDTDKLSYRISPTNFYPLIARAATQEQAERMIKEHFYNPDEFWGEWILPSIARNDSAYTGQDYWRGSIWAPMNFLVYLGMRNYNLPGARKDLCDKSRDLLLKEWTERGYIRENYQAETGGAPDRRSEHFYHWGALLGMINLIEQEYVPAPEIRISDLEKGSE